MCNRLLLHTRDVVYRGYICGFSNSHRTICCRLKYQAWMWTPNCEQTFVTHSSLLYWHSDSRFLCVCAVECVYRLHVCLPRSERVAFQFFMARFCPNKNRVDRLLAQIERWKKYLKNHQWWLSLHSHNLFSKCMACRAKKQNKNVSEWGKKHSEWMSKLNGAYLLYASVCVSRCTTAV